MEELKDDVHKLVGAAIFEDDAEAVEGEGGVDGDVEVTVLENPLGVATGGDDFGLTVKGFLEVGDEFSHDATIADVRAERDGLFGATTDGGDRSAELDLGKEGSFFVEIGGHEGKARGDDTTNIGGAIIEDFEVERGAKVNNDEGRAIAGETSCSIGEAVCSDAFRVGIVEVEAEGALGGDEARGAAEGFAYEVLPLGVDLRNDGGDGDPFYGFRGDEAEHIGAGFGVATDAPIDTADTGDIAILVKTEGGGGVSDVDADKAH
jgi:hypothetical protein